MHLNLLGLKSLLEGLIIACVGGREAFLKLLLLLQILLLYIPSTRTPVEPMFISSLSLSSSNTSSKLHNNYYDVLIY